MMFDDETNYKLNKDYNHFARMTTFNGNAVIVGIVVGNYKTENGLRLAKNANKYLEIFDRDENTWLLKSPADESKWLNWITQFALVPLQNNLLHIGGNDIGSSPTSSSYGRAYESSYFKLDSMYKKWTKMGKG